MRAVGQQIGFTRWTAPSRTEFVTSIDTASRVVGWALRALFALLDDCGAILSLLSGAGPLGVDFLARRKLVIRRVVLVAVVQAARDQGEPRARSVIDAGVLSPRCFRSGPAHAVRHFTSPCVALGI